MAYEKTEREIEQTVITALPVMWVKESTALHQSFNRLLLLSVILRVSADTETSYYPSVHFTGELIICY